jgi:hypothetical protein
MKMSAFEHLPRNQRKDLQEAAEMAHRRAQAPWSPSGLSNPLSSVVNRRAFLRGGAAMIGGAMLARNLERLPGASLEAAQCSAGGPIVSPWGPIAPVRDPETGLNLLKLPPGFSYRSYGWTGDFMNDVLGTPTPPLHDGMAVIQELDRSHLMLVRNHEVNHPGPAAFGDGSLAYDSVCGAARPISSLIWRRAGSSRRSRASAATSATAQGV